MLPPREDVLGPCAYSELDTAGAAAPPFATYLQSLTPSCFPQKAVLGMCLMACVHFGTHEQSLQVLYELGKFDVHRVSTLTLDLSPPGMRLRWAPGQGCSESHSQPRLR